MKKFADLTEMSKLSASELNRLMASMERVSNLTAEYPIEVYNSPGAINLRLNQSEIWVRLTDQATVASASGSGCHKWRYAWEEVQFAENGSIETKPGGRTGSTTADWAFEVNGSCVEVGSIVTLFPAWTGEWGFSLCCAIEPSSSSSSSSSISSSSSSSSSESHSTSTSISISTSDGSGCVEVVTDVACDGAGLTVTKGTLCGTVTIGGVQYPVEFTVA